MKHLFVISTRSWVSVVAACCMKAVVDGLSPEDRDLVVSIERREELHSTLLSCSDCASATELEL